MAEIWDAYDRQFHKIENITLIRGQNIEDGMYHLVSEIIVKHRDGTYLLMQRDPRKRHGGKWELTAGGSALKGETPHNRRGCRRGRSDRSPADERTGCRFPPAIPGGRTDAVFLPSGQSHPPSVPTCRRGAFGDPAASAGRCHPGA